MSLFLPRELESSHISLCGATRSGKTTLIRGFMYQALARGIPFVALDVKEEYVQEFWQPGDWVLNPGDERCPVWALEEEGGDELHCMALGHSAFPDEPRDQPFFKKNPRDLLAHLLSRYHPSTGQLASWMINDAEIDKRVQGSGVAKMLSTTGGEGRWGILATFSGFGRSLRLWPEDKERPRFSAKSWAKKPTGNIFVTSNPNTIDGLRPVQSMLIDLIIMEKMTSRNGPCLFVIDEPGSMQRLPKLETAVSLGGASGLTIMIAYQEVAQLKVYGELWRSLVSNPAVKIIMRTSEEESAKHVSGLIGEVQRDRIRESKSLGNLFFHKAHRNLQEERIREPLILTGEIQSLKPGHGILSMPGYATRFVAKYLPPVIRAPRCIERTIPQTILPETEPAPRMSRNARAKQAALPLSP